MNEIREILNDFLMDNDFDCEVDFDEIFCYSYADSIIYCSLKKSPLDEVFRTFAFECGLTYDVSNFLLSFLHELGHHETLDFISDSVYTKCEKIKNNLTDTPENAIIYYKLPVEIIATQWGVDFANSHKTEIKKLDKKLKKLLTI